MLFEKFIFYLFGLFFFLFSCSDLNGSKVFPFDRNLQVLQISNKRFIYDVNIKLIFKLQEMKVEGFTGCNNFHASFSQNKEFIKIDNFQITKNTCSSEKLDLQEKLFISNLQSTKFWYIDFEDDRVYLFLYQFDKGFPLILLIL